MGRWGDGEIGRWGDREIGRWGDGEREGGKFLPFPPPPVSLASGF
ncbi:hypothetical protein [Okeania sp. SIO2C9]|nr:hypothetical protein [Okeania sp. SIO2C9]